MKALAGGLTFLFLSVFAGQAPAQDVSKQESEARKMIQRLDRDKDGALSLEEFPRRNAALFRRIDRNNDGLVSLDEDTRFRVEQAKRDRNQPQRLPLPEGAVVHRDLVYDKIGERELPLDLYLPKSETRLPVVMWIHGGGWRTGSKGSAGPARQLIGQGYAVVDVEYRLSGEAIFPAQIQDCKAAVRWIRANAKKYNLNDQKIGVWGSSAGGHLAALVGTSGDVQPFETQSNADFSSRVQAVCDWFGPTDLLLMNQQAIEGSTLDHDAPNSPESQLIGGPIQEEPFTTRAQKANPINYVSEDDPPFLIVHGDNDKLVSYRQSELLQEALAKANVEFRLQIEPGAGHGFGGGKKSKQQLAQEAAEFFDKHLKPAAISHE